MSFKTKLAISLACFISFNAFAASSDLGWRATNVSGTKVFSSMLVSPTNGNVYGTGVMGPMSVSSDGCATWSQITASGLTNNTMFVLATDASGNLYGGTAGLAQSLTASSGVFMLANNAQAWVAVGTGFPNTPSVGSLLIAPNGDIYAGTIDAGVWKLVKGASVWTAVGNQLAGIQHTTFSALAMDGAGNLYAAAALNDQSPTAIEGGIFKLAAGSNTWAAETTGLTQSLKPGVLVMALALDNNDNLYAGTMGAGAFKLAKGSDNWVSESQGLSNLNVLQFFRDNTGTLYAATIVGVFKLSQGSDTWVALSSNGLPTTDPQFGGVLGIVMNSTGKLCISTGSGVFVQK